MKNLRVKSILSKWIDSAQNSLFLADGTSVIRYSRENDTINVSFKDNDEQTFTDFITVYLNTAIRKKYIIQALTSIFELE